MTRRWVAIDWEYDEPEPGGICTGFEVAIFSGDTIEAGTLAQEITFLEMPGARRYVCLLELRTKINLKAAVRACYGEYRSAWINAYEPAAFEPETLILSEDGEIGCIRFPDGTMLQWATSTAVEMQGHVTVNWPQPFPKMCYSASATPVISNQYTSGGSEDGVSSWFHLISKDKQGATLYRQGSADNRPLRAHVVGWGR
jgi:hypothetical protein